MLLLAALVLADLFHIFTKLDLPPDEEQHRQVLAVLTYLRT